MFHIKSLSGCARAPEKLSRPSRAHLECQLAVEIALVLGVEGRPVNDVVQGLTKPVFTQL